MSLDPGDHAARRRVTGDLDTNLMVVAGAGTGKTTALVGRVLALVRSEAVSLEQIAAITFTEAAAAELRAQIFRAVDTAAAGGDAPMVAARGQVDDAAICTLHSFAQRLLREQCVDAGLPPGFEVLDDTAEWADFDDRWNRFADTLLEDSEAERALSLGFALGLRPTDLATVAWNLHAHWDRLEDGGLEYFQASPRCDDQWPAADTGPVVAALDRALGTITWCTDDNDKMAWHLRGPVAEARAHLVAARSDLLGGLQLLGTLPPFRCAHGRQENWTGHITDVRAACAEAEQIRLDLVDGLRRAVLGDLVARVAAFTVAAAEDRRQVGRLTFHDLLVHARRLVRREGEGLDTVRRRYRRLLIDEFQDTDPIQIELAARLAAAVEGSADVSGARPGGLFVVGDPQQSIYRFRRADIDLFDSVSAAMDATVVLDTNFRSVPGIVAFVNTVFDEVFGHGDVPGQAPHHVLYAARPVPPGAATASTGRMPGPAVAHAVQLSFEGIERPTPRTSARRQPGRRQRVGWLRPAPVPVVTVGGALTVSIPEVRRRAAGDAATAIDQVVHRQWWVDDPDSGGRRPARYGDIAVLIPARSFLSALEDALEEAGIPYRLEGAALLWGAEEVREVLAVLRATDDPADAVAVLGALRSPGLACGDDDLVTWHDGGGSWDPRADPPPGLEHHPVAEAMAALHRLHRRRWWSEPSAMVGAAYRELRSFELALAHRRPRDFWHRLRWLQDQARLFDETPGGTLRAFLTWARLRAEGDGRVGGVGPPDPDDDAVRVMTIHGAKGLEFPVVVLAGLEQDQADRPPLPAVVWTEHGVPEVRVGLFHSAGFEQAGLRAQHHDVLEQHRLLYVALTRARDHLVVCLHHKQRTGGPDSSLAALVTRICSENPTLWRALPDETGAAGTTAPPPAPSARPAPDTEGARRLVTALPADWDSERRQMLATRRRRPVATATAVAHAALDGSPTATFDPGAVVGRWPPAPLSREDDTDVARRRGRAVHGALADLDPSTGCDAAGRPADEVARTSALAHGLEAHTVEVEAMVRRALASASVTAAAGCRSWREVYVTVPVGEGGVLEGFVDLLYEEDDGLVVIDYKTERIPAGPALDAAVASHRLQVAAYATALEASTGRAVRRCVLVFVAGDDPWEIVVDGDDLHTACAEARRRAEVLVAN